jgi:ankyrin repeat protein
VEGVCLGDGGMGAADCAALAAAIEARQSSLAAVLPAIDAMIAAVSEGNAAEVAALIAQRPGLAYTAMEDGLPAILFSQYRGRRDVVRALMGSGMRLTMGEAAAVGEEARVRKIAAAWPAAVHEYTSDGFTPLQLACFFGHAPIAAFLLEQGADIHAVAQNAMAIQPLHAAVAGQYADIVRLLIAHGADVNARQQSGFTPLMAARQNNNPEIEALLLAAGAE